MRRSKSAESSSGSARPDHGPCIDAGVFVLLGLPGPGPEALSASIGGGIIVMIAVDFVSSYRVWNTDPGKRQT